MHNGTGGGQGRRAGAWRIQASRYVVDRLQVQGGRDVVERASREAGSPRRPPPTVDASSGRALDRRRPPQADGALDIGIVFQFYLILLEMFFLFLSQRFPPKQLSAQ